MNEYTEKKDDKRRDDLRELAVGLTRKPVKSGSIDEISLESRRRAIAYGRARGNS